MSPNHARHLPRSVMALLVPLVLAGLVPAQAPAAADPASVVPAGTMLHLRLEGRVLREKGGSLAIARILAEPEVAKFLEPLRGSWAELKEMGSQTIAPMLGVGVDELLALLDGRLSLSLIAVDKKEVVHSPDFKSTESVPVFVLTADGGPALATLRTMVPHLESMVGQGMGQVETRTIAGREVKVFAIEGAPFNEICVHLGDTRAIVATSAAALEGALAAAAGGGQGSLAASRDYAETVKEAVRSDPVLFVYADVPRLAAAMSDVVDSEAGGLKSLFQVMGLDALRTVAYSMELDGAAIRERIYAHVPEKTGIFGSMVPKSVELGAERLAPADAAIFGSGAYDFPSAFDWLMRLVTTMDSGEARDFQKGLQEVEAKLGIRIRDDLLAELGPEYAGYLAWPGQALIPDAVVLVRVRDRAKVEAAMGRIEQALSERVRFDATEFRGTPIRYADLGDFRWRNGVPPLRPSWAIVEGYLVVTLWPQSIKNLVAGLQAKTPRLANHPDFGESVRRARGSRDPKSMLGISYIDVKRCAGFLLDNAVPLAQSLIPNFDEVPLRMADLPPTDAVTKHLFGFAGVTCATERGFVAEYASPTGLLPMYTGAVVAIGIPMLFVARQSAMVMTFEPMDDSAKYAMTLESMHEMGNAVEAFAAAEGRLPTADEWPSFLWRGSSKHPEPYMPSLSDLSGALDSWGRPVEYAPEGKGFTLRSPGADGIPGGEDMNADITVTR